MDRKGGLLVISGPSGSGKTTICRRLAARDEVTLAVSATTRPKRPGEVHGKDYFFLSRDEFEERLAQGEFLEHNEVFGNDVLYGSLKSEVDQGLENTTGYYLMEIDVVGALNLKKLDYDGVYIFVMPPSLEELRKRLEGRGTDRAKSVEERLKKAEWELEQADEYDLVLMNDDLEEAIAEAEHFLRLT
ncbi:MAG: guanylate kinase [Planctomycetota bacterium]